ncbi:fimbrial protein [Pseudomonas aeruginosa]|uniref:fimbrial protein n=1 Tax=Pseudomonas aeruginosa TaxID=287 RepID=UPI001F20BF8C|nr:fimbrial protein [Pseudomonas aeruginosa]
MKKPLAMALALLIGTTAVSAHAADGIIKITGSVVGTTCTVEGTDTSNGPQGTLKTINLQLDPVSISALNAPSKMAGGKPFTIRLSDCTAQNAKVKFETMGLVDTSSGFLKNEGDAENVQVALTTSDDELIKIGQDDGQEITLVEGKGEANFKAYYVASTGAAEPGSVDTSATFSLIYN